VILVAEGQCTPDNFAVAEELLCSDLIQSVEGYCERSKSDRQPLQGLLLVSDKMGSLQFHKPLAACPAPFFARTHIQSFVYSVCCRISSPIGLKALSEIKPYF